MSDTNPQNENFTGRDSNGRFAKGNAGGPGNPFGGKVAKFRTMLQEAMTDENMHEIVEKLIDIAKEGNLQAIKLVLGYTVGKPGAQCAESEWDSGAPSPDYSTVTKAASLCERESWPDGLSGGSGTEWSAAPSPNGVFSTASEVTIAPEKESPKPRTAKRKLTRQQRKRKK